MSWGWCWLHWGVKFRLFKIFLTRQGSDSLLTDFRKIFLDMGTFIYPGTPDLIPCRWEHSFLTFLKTAVLTNMSSLTNFLSPSGWECSLASATLSKCWYNVHNYKRQRNDCLKHFKGLDFCYNSVSTLSLNIVRFRWTSTNRVCSPSTNSEQSEHHGGWGLLMFGQICCCSC